MKKIIYVFSAALLCLVSCNQGLNLEQSVRTTSVPPKEGDLARVTFYVTVPEAPLYATQTKAVHDIGEQPNSIENGDLFVAVFGAGSSTGVGGQLQHFLKATLMKDPSTEEKIGVDPPINHDLTGDPDEEGIAGKVFKYAYQVLLPISDDALVLDFFAGAYDSEGNLYSLDNPLPVDYEANVMPLLRSINGKAAYWQRVEIPGVKAKKDSQGNYVIAQVLDEDGEPISTESEEYEADDIPALHDIRLVRNFAKVTFSTVEGVDFTLNGFYLVDTPLYGTVAPYSGTSGYANAYTTSTDAAIIMNSYMGYITSTELSSGIEGKEFLEPGKYVYMYERTLPDLNKPYGETGAILDVTWNANSPVASSLGDNLHRYYKVSFIDGKGAVPILRNIVYNFQISAITADTHPTSAAAAYASPFLGDISANIATSMLDEITNNRSLIKVSEMSKTTIGDARDIDINYWFYPDVANNPTDVVVYHGTTYNGSQVTIQTIIEEVAGYQAAIESAENTTSSSDEMGTVKVTTVASVSGVVKKSKLKILGQWGTQRALYREVEFTVMEKQNFEQGDLECSVSELSSDAVGQDVTVTIVLPDELPRDIFPLSIKIEPENNSLRSVPYGTGADAVSALPVKHGKSAFNSNKNNYYFVKTITYDDYAELVDGSYVFTNSFPCYFKTRLSSGNGTAIAINDLDEMYFEQADLTLE